MEKLFMRREKGIRVAKRDADAWRAEKVLLISDQGIVMVGRRKIC